jgi:transmembrane sensor
MGFMDHSARPPELEKEVSVWLARLERGLRPEEGDRLREWLGKPANRKALLETATLWHGPDLNALLAALLPRDYSRVMKKPAPAPRSLALLLRACALGFAVVLSVAVFSGQMPWSGHGAEGAPKKYNETFATAVGETREVVLADGSRVMLNTGTRIGVSITPNRREVLLIQGEATFDVAPDATRPFHVNAGRREFQAIGTRFNLREISDENVELTVTEGVVKVLDAPPRLPQTPARRRDPITYGEATVVAFQRAEVEPGFQYVTHIQPGEVQARLAWQQGLIVANDKALEDLIAEVERYTNTKFVLADELRSVRVTGSFRTGNVNNVRQTLRRHFSVRSQRDSQGRVVLTALVQS